MKATTYKVTLTGTSPLLMHKDNLEGSAMVKAWTNGTEADVETWGYAVTEPKAGV